MPRRRQRAPKRADPRQFIVLREHHITLKAVKPTPAKPDGEPERVITIATGHLRGGGPARIETLHRKVELDKQRQLARLYRLHYELMDRKRMELGLPKVVAA